MKLMLRRDVIRKTSLPVLATISLAGCTSSTGDDDNADGDQTSPTEVHNETPPDITPYDPKPDVLEGIIVEKPPEDAEVTPSNDDRIADVDALHALLEKATDPDADRKTLTTNGKEYEMVHYTEGSPEEMEEAAEAIDDLPGYSGDEAPSGTYIEHENSTVATKYERPD